MQNYKKYFKGKKITVIGLGLLGGALNDIKFLVEHGARVTVTDLKDAEILKSSILKLKKYKGIKFVLGQHRIEDFQNINMILEPGNVPKDSQYLLEAKKNKIPIFVSESMFIKYAPEITIVGVTGTRGKSMTSALIYEILSKSIKGRKVYLGGNIRNVSTLALLNNVNKGDIVVMELDSQALHYIGKIKKSPHISVFTSFMPDHMNYYKDSMEDYFDDKANIFKFQTEKDFLITDTKVRNWIGIMPKSQLILADKKAVRGFDFIVPGEHQRQNLAYAVAVAEILGIPKNAIRKTVKKFKGVEGRLQLLRTYKGIKIYNDNNATTPEATIAGIEALKKNPQVGPVGNHRNHRSDLWEKNIVLICGGADKNLSLENLTKEINKSCKFVSFIPGTGTDLLINNYELQIKNKIAKDFKDAVKEAMKQAKKGDIILFSPAFASFGLFNNEYERNDLFVKIIKGLK